MLRGETEGRKGKQPDGSSKTREVKIGCVFTQLGINAKGFPEREPASTSYTAAIEGAEDFGRRLYAEAFKRGVELAKEVVVVADGASWIWNLVHEHFPKAIQIVDLYHARQHLYNLQSLLSKKTLQNCLHLLEEGKIEKLIQFLRRVESKDPPDADKICQEIGCFQNHAHRFKKSGMFWSVEGANDILQLRTTELSGYWETFGRLASQADSYLPYLQICLTPVLQQFHAVRGQTPPVTSWATAMAMIPKSAPRKRRKRNDSDRRPNRSTSR